MRPVPIRRKKHAIHHTQIVRLAMARTDSLAFGVIGSDNCDLFDGDGDRLDAYRRTLLKSLIESDERDAVSRRLPLVELRVARGVDEMKMFLRKSWAR